MAAGVGNDQGDACGKPRGFFFGTIGKGRQEGTVGLQRNDPAAYATHQISRLKAALFGSGNGVERRSGRDPVLVRVYQPGMTALAAESGAPLAPPGLSVLRNAEYVCSELDYSRGPSKYLCAVFAHLWISEAAKSWVSALRSVRSEQPNRWGMP